MIKIRKGNDELLVSKKTFESIFKRIGYEVIENKEKNINESNNNKTKLEVESKKTITEQKTNNTQDEKNDNKLEELLDIISNNSKKSEKTNTLKK